MQENGELRRVLAFVGGTGPEGIGLAVRMARAGHEIVVGSRSIERAEEAAQKILEKVPGGKVKGMLNLDAVVNAEVVVNTLPYVAQEASLSDLREAIGSKLVISTVVPLSFDKDGISAIPVPEGSAAEQGQRLLPGATVVGAFQTLSATHLLKPERPIDADVLVTGNDEEARKQVMALAEQIEGVRAVDGGRLANSQYVEHITALLLNVNKRYKTHTEFRVTGLGDGSSVGQ